MPSKDLDVPDAFTSSKHPSSEENPFFREMAVIAEKGRSISSIQIFL